MNKLLLLAIMMLCIGASYGKDKGPKVEVTDDTVSVDGKNIFILEKIKGSNPGIRNYFIENLSGKKLAFIKYEEYTDPKEISSSNPHGNENYYQITFIESKQTAEFRFYLKVGKLAEYLIEQKLIADGTISEESEQEFILVNGNPYTMKRNELGGNNSTIIINNTTPTPRNGVHFNIGN